jgi:hypothetical protein
MKSNSLIVKICATLVGLSFVIAFFFWLSYGRKSAPEASPSAPFLTEEKKREILKDLSASPVPLSDEKKQQILKDLQATPPSSSVNTENIGGTSTLTPEQREKILRDLQK